MLRRWLAHRKSTTASGRLEAIWIADQAGAPMCERAAVDVTEAGLTGDRYATGHGHWHTVEACPVTLICSAEMERATRRARRLRQPATPVPGDHRRNLVVSGLRRSPRAGILRIGAVRFAITRPRPPCGWLNQVVGYNLAGALRQDSGICLRPLGPGTIRRGDTVHWEAVQGHSRGD
ncbi:MULTISPECIES: MOSC domain-containing protein [unclassified Thioalkalivibrio]|uniref:MOSC domain-containing protein n=1 Tax=unclassified Thioalkalivibrio TaxID=2621013 RepID=UPI0003729398|nr:MULTISPECIES: MOSC domain-containing protein [unclassified Thioalkalivibrio]